MTDLTLEEKSRFAASRASLLAAQKHFYDAAEPWFPLGFSVTYRNPGHWDITARAHPGEGPAWEHRAFRVRGEPGNVVIYDERWNPHRERGGEPLRFRSVTGAMMWVVEEMMQEPPHDP